MASLKANTRTKTIIYWVVIIVLAVLWISFLAAFIKEKNKNNEVEAPVTTPTPPTKPPPTENDYLLDNSVVPSHYQLRIRSDPQLNYFNGSVVIDLTVQKDQVNQFKLHCNNLLIERFSVTSSDGTKLGTKSVQIDPELQTCIFPLESNTNQGNYSLVIDFSAEFKEGQITGFYRSSYVTVDNQVRYLTATKFEPTYARMAFPCFDEPRFKTTYEVILEHPNSLRALSNEIELETKSIENGAMSQTTFAKTVPMPTYLVAYVISDFDYSETKTTTGLRVRVYSRPDQVKKTRYAVDAAAQILRYYETYTGIDYKLHKLDLIGLPEFVSGAMENWGLVAYKETYILFSESESSAADMRQIANVIAHELAHMWFGNLVTLNWWSELWLNEGYATFFEYYGQNYLNKSWNVGDQFLTGEVHRAIRADSLQSAHPLVSTEVLTPSQITAMFNTISYSKGAAVLSMIQNVIGKNKFQECARRYLKENEFQTVDSEKMLSYFKDAINEVTNIDGGEFMKKWVYSNGFPILNVERVTNTKKSRRKRNTVKTQQLKVTQKTLNQTVPDEQWYIYVTYQTPNKKGQFLMGKLSDSVTLEIEPGQWFKINNDGRDYYIVNYAPADRKLLAQQLKSKPQTFSATDRANLLFDSYRLAEISTVPYEDLLDLFDYLKSETHYLPWSVAQSAISSLNSKLRNADGATALQYKQYMRDLVSKTYDTKVNINANANQLSFEDMMLQNTIISLACYAEYEKCINQCYQLFRGWVDEGVGVDANIRSYVYKYGLQASNKETDWMRLWDLYQSEKDALEKSKLMSALTSTKSSTLLAQLISYSTNQSLINNENFFAVQQGIASNSELGRGLIWDYIKNNWNVLVERFGLEDRRLGNYVKSVVSGFGTTTRLQEVQTFFAQNPEAGAGEGARLEAIETISNNIKWILENEQDIGTSLTNRDPISKPWLDWRLDEAVRPVHYDINLTVLVDEETFSGSVRIEVDVKRPIRHLILHSLNLNITRSVVSTKTSFTRVSSESQPAFPYQNNQFFVIPMEDIILPGAYVAQLDFNGTLSKTLSGLYLSQYKASNGEMVKLATTQFEAAYARKAFPCFDEPQFKATFTMQVSHQPKFTAISNMPVDYVRQGTELKTTVFQKSVKMSTYLVALVVSDFVSKASPRASNFSVYTYNKDINLAKTDYALDVGPRILDFYAKDYFKIGYPLPKLDMISIPDFSMGAMENWGLVTYRDVYLLYDAKETSSSSKMAICSIIAHELAHMWYGNLVTIKWWDELWLNEGFAQFMQYKATAAVEPSWKYEEHFANKELSRVFETDSSLSTHSILTVVSDENDIQSVFDPVTYAKGASIIRMLENTLGEKNFRAGVTNYLNKNSYRNTITTDLWRELANVATDSLDIAQLMDSWVTKEGFPVVTVVNRNGIFSFKQERFLKDSSTSNIKYTWFIPVTYRVIDTKIADLTLESQHVYFNSKEMDQKIEVSDGQLVKFNVDQKGVYIVNYETKQWEEWATLLNDSDSLIWKKLSVLDRNTLINDAFYLARSGRLNYRYALNLAEFLKNERSLVVWRTAAEHLTYLRPFVTSEDQGVAFNQWIITKLIGGLYEELGWDAKTEDDLNKRQLRVLILNLACQSDHKPCKDSASTKFDQWKNDGKVVDPDIFPIFLYHTMTFASEDMFNFVSNKYNSAQSTNEKMIFLNALTAVRDTKLLQELINKSLDTNFLRSQDLFTFLYYLAQNPIGLELAWKFYKENYPTIVERYGVDDSNLGRAIYRFAVYFNKQSKQQEVNDFYLQYPEAGAGALYRQQALELIQANLAWSKAYYSSVIEQITTKGCPYDICPWNVYRLNDAVKPDKYDLTIQINTDTFQYNGTVKAYITVTKEVEHIILHAADILDVASPKVYPSSSSNDLSKGTGFRYPPLEFYVIPLKTPLQQGSYVVETNFNGSLLLGGTVGLYRGWYKQDNKTINLAATQLESTHARKVFPCFDEPHFKQKIAITVIHEESKPTTLSNMDVISTQDRPGLPGWKETKYKETELMVTYLIAILVSDFQCTSKDLEGIGPEHILKHYESKLGMKYKFPKLDQIALPQFSPGAMENWGLVKYREKMLLWTEDEDTAAEQRSVCAVIAHELAHMWFGNLVTCDFWGDLWLNEAFASYMEYGAVDAAEPNWKYWDMVVYYDTFNALFADSSDTSQPIVRAVTTPSLMSYSSSIVYNKGATVLNMFNNVMGEDVFYNALKAYLEKYQFKTAVTENLFDEFIKVWPHTNKVEAKKFLDSWTRKAGFPYLNITIDNSTNPVTYKYTQQRFLQNGAKPTAENPYVIPYVYYVDKTFKKSEIEFLTEKSGTLKGLGVKVNPNFSGFYLVNYPESEWNRIVDDLKNKEKFTVSDRSELILSTFLLARAKLTPYLTPFKLFNYLVHEEHFVPWYFYQYSISNLAVSMGRTEYRESLLRFERRLVSKQYLGIEMWNDTLGTTTDKSFRQQLIRLACRSGHVQCLQDAYQMFNKWKTNPADNFPPNLRTNILYYGIRASKLEEDYEFVWQNYLKENSSSTLKSYYLTALSFISDSSIMKMYIERSLDENLVPVADFVSLFNAVIEKHAHEKLTWNFFTENYSMLSRKLSRSQMDIIISAFAGYVTTSERRQEIDSFLSSKSDAGVTQSGRLSALSIIDKKLSWMSQHKTEVGKWLAENACGSDNPEPCPWSKLRIDSSVVVPTRYDLLIQVNLTTNIYNGSVDIDVQANNKFQYIVLHAADMLSTSLFQVTHKNASVVPSVVMFRHRPLNYVVLEFTNEQEVGHYTLTFNFTANLLDAGLSGLYISNYTDGDQKYKIASTQFEFYDARKVFPCFDEPAFKTNFSVSIIHDSTMNTTLSNMEIEKSGPLSDTSWIETKFKESVKMSSYLVAMLVSDFVCNNQTANDVKYGVCASRVQQHKMDYALKVAPKCLQHLEKKLDFNYPLNKVDLLAIPDFYYGAMENWGLITFRESALLYHENDTTSATKMSVLSVISHEIAHFWFGNLVTCNWWDNLWLNEAFATFMQYTTMNAVQPDWKIFDLFLMNDFESAVITDSVDSVHPIIRPISTTKEIDSFNSNVIYSKGATVVRMIQFMMGEDNFYNALQDYLKKFKYQNAVAANLTDAFDQNWKDKPSDLTMKVITKEWLEQKGFPYLNVTKESDGYKVEQARFLLQPASSESNTVWKVPVSFYNDDNYKDYSIKYLKDKSTTISELTPKELFKLNVGHNGFYLVNYPSEMWQKWAETLAGQSTSKVPVSDRAGLLLDSFYLAQAKLLSYNIPLSLGRYLINEKEITPWTIAIRGFSSIRKYVLHGSKYSKQFQNYLQGLTQTIYEDLGWEEKPDETDVTRRLRAIILDFACSNQHSDCLSNSQTKFTEWIEAKKANPEHKISPNLLNIVLKYGLKEDTDAENWYYLWSQYLTESSVSLKQTYINALANTRDQKSLTMLLNQALEAKVIRSQDVYSVFVAVINSNDQTNLQTLWNFYQTNYERMAGPSSPLRPAYLSSMLNSIASQYFFTEARKTEVQSFFSRYPNLGLSTRERSSVLNTISNNIVWMSSRMKEVERFLLCGSDQCPFTEFRLSPTVQPVHYDLSLKVDLVEDKFSGNVQIDVNVTESVDYLYLHASPTLQITKSQVFNHENALPIQQNFSYSAYEFWVMKLTKPVKGEIKLKFEFNSKLATDMSGFYRSEYYNPTTGERTKLASTQFQDLYARRALPCFDEPAFKATFQVTIEHHKNYTATLSNTKESSPVVDTDMVKTTFEKTPKMVTYLLAFMVSDFKNKIAQPSDYEVRVWASPPEIDKTTYTASIAPTLIKAFENKFNYSYQLSKMDLVAIPDFSAGAMENWGLLTFRETALLWDQHESAASDKMYVASVVAHEIAHMWFGNLVTCEWWSDLWLNEAFASFLEWFSVDVVEPGWKYPQIFYITDYIPGMNADSSGTAHPLVRTVNSPSQVPYISNIIYQKGSSILRMFQSVLEDQFYIQLQQYLKEKEYQTSKSQYLIEALGKAEVVGLNVTQFLTDWTMQAGFPYLTLTKIQGSNNYTVVQQRFFANGSSSDNTQKWTVPLTYYIDFSKDDTKKTLYLSNKEETIELDASSDLVKFNVDSQGFYIVNYPVEEWKKWADSFKNADTLKTWHLTPQDYSHLLYDAFTLAKANMLPYSVALELTVLLRNNQMFSVWSTGSTIFSQLWPYFRTIDQSGLNQLMQHEFQTYAISLVTDIYNKFGLQGEDPLDLTDQRLRTTVTAFACAYGYDLCLAEAQVEFKKWRLRPNTQLSPNVISTVLRYAIQESSDSSDWHFLWTKYNESHSTVMKLKYLQGLAQTSNKQLLNLLLDYANDQSVVRAQDYLSVYTYMLRTPIGFDVAWSYFQANYTTIRTKLSSSRMGTLANNFATYLYTAQQRADFARFFADHRDHGVSATNLQKAYETIDNNIMWASSYRLQVFDWLRTSRPSTKSSQH